MIPFSRYIGIIIATVLIYNAPSVADTLPFNRLVTTPTAGSIPFRAYTLETHLFDGGGLVETVTFGLHDLINVGVSYGGADLIGASSSVFQPHLAFQARIRFVEETMYNPAVSIGFDSQGIGPYVKSGEANRFQVKSRGVYIVASRNYRLLGDLGFHLGANYSLEDSDGDKDPSFWGGFNKSLGPYAELCAEYDCASNMNGQGKLTADKGFLNTAVKCTFGGSFVMEFDMRNLLRSDVIGHRGVFLSDPQPAREIRFFYRNRL